MGRNPFGQYIPAQSTCHMASIQLSHGEGGAGKARRVHRTKRAKLNGNEASSPFANHLRIHENKIARGHAKNGQPIREHPFEFVSSERDMPKNEGAKQAARRPSDINGGYYY